TSRLLHGFRFEAPWESLRVGNGARWYNGGGWSPSTEGALRQLASRPDALLLAATDANPQGELFAERLRALAVETGCDWSRLRPPEEDWNETLKIREKEKRERKEDGVPHSHRPRQGKLRPAEPALDPAGRDAGGPEGVMKD
ncbi:toprim domain-containing protein, partial [Sinorhizobium glycinis]